MEIIKKTRISKKEFLIRLNKLKSIVNFVSKKEFHKFLIYVEKVSPDKDDADFLALALKLKTFLWSNDKMLKQQDKVKVFSTKEIINILL